MSIHSRIASGWHDDLYRFHKLTESCPHIKPPDGSCPLNPVGILAIQSVERLLQLPSYPRTDDIEFALRLMDSQLDAPIDVLLARTRIHVEQPTIIAPYAVESIFGRP